MYDSNGSRATANLSDTRNGRAPRQTGDRLFTPCGHERSTGILYGRFKRALDRNATLF